MNGATAELPPKTINTPRSSSTKITGIRKNFFLAIKKLVNSFKNSIINILNQEQTPLANCLLTPN